MAIIYIEGIRWELGHEGIRFLRVVYSRVGHDGCRLFRRVFQVFKDRLLSGSLWRVQVIEA